MLPRVATPRDEDDFSALWVEYLTHLEKAGSLLPANEETLALFVQLFREITHGRMRGLSLIVPGVAVCLWGPEIPVPTRYGLAIQGQGTYVRESARGQGLGSAMYAVGFGHLRDMGFQVFVGSVDGGNALGMRNARRLDGELVQLVQCVRL